MVKLLSDVENVLSLNKFLPIVIMIIGVSVAIPSLDAFAETIDVSIPATASSIFAPRHYSPSEITVKVNDVAEWTNNDSTTHTVTSGTHQGGPDGVFNSGILDPNEQFRYQFVITDIGKQPYYCTIHPWMNGIITILDVDGTTGAKISVVGSIQAAQDHLVDAQGFIESAEEFVETGYSNQAGVSFIQAGISYHHAALEYALLEDHENAAMYHHEAALQYEKAAIHFEEWEDYTQSVISYHEAGVHHHAAGVSYQLVGEDRNAGKHFAESILNKGKAKYGSDYVLAPKHQMEWLADPADISCRPGMELVFKSSDNQPKCLTPESAEKLIERGWARQ